MSSPFDHPQAQMDAQIVQAVYAVVNEPQSLPQLMGLLAMRVEGVLSSAASSTEITAALLHLREHFESASALLERRGRTSDPAAGAVRNLRENPGPAFILRPSGTVRYANAAAIEAFGLAEERALPESLFTPPVRRRLLGALSSLSENKHTVIDTFEAQTRLAAKPLLRLALTATSTPEGLLGKLSSASVIWLDYVGRHFAAAYGLTPVETEITKAIIMGQSLEDLAATRGRAIGTLRNQKKRLLAKLGIHSQTELACLYAGFAQLSRLPPEADKVWAFSGEADRASMTLPLCDDERLHIEMVGPEDGRPVLFLHSLLGGTGLTPQHRRLIRRRKLRLIMPLRPFYGATRIGGGPHGQAERYAEALLRLLDEIGAASVPVIFANAASPYAFALASVAPLRVERLVGAGAHLPLKETEAIRAMNPVSRLSHTFAAHYPFMLDFFCRSVLHMTGSGFDEEFVLGMLFGSQADQAMIADAEFRYLARNTLTYIGQEEPNPAANELAVAALPWYALTADQGVPVTLFYGEEDPRFGGRPAERLTALRPHIETRTMPEAGQLVFYQHCAEVLDEAMGRRNSVPA
ncbi:hypothetical protein [Parvularcula maris]|uniref:HTH luxR-type domain-containing protein n=1 Tax=Parvularcula maris TaxID=2965077 RepID=A0A9X2RK72_9PROT|nr:hypothetical protein [Parvularcula maris]MCQ8185478.1 hypothetical protein [Parvularcula maris]